MGTEAFCLRKNAQAFGPGATSAGGTKRPRALEDAVCGAGRGRPWTDLRGQCTTKRAGRGMDGKFAPSFDGRNQVRSHLPAAPFQADAGWVYLGVVIIIIDDTAQDQARTQRATLQSGPATAERVHKLAA